tara:strand:+ start:79 stop:846 length:768 start_codon:yes stop_codon:yes gene_type:complete
LILARSLSKFKNISHGFFGKKGGYSRGIYKSLNCGWGSLDKKKNIKKNIIRICHKIKCERKNLILLNQIHSNKFHLINNVAKLKNKNLKLKGDAAITGLKGIALGILTADCAPIFIYDSKLSIISAVHAGWKGSLKGVTEKVLDFLIRKGSKKNNLRVVIGPCINQKNYEVKDDFYKKFIKTNKNNKIFFKNYKKKIYFNLPKYICYQIKKKGVKNVEIIKKDTFSSTNDFFSARRSLKCKHVDYGRNISVIMIK